jgi:nucleoid-associated protein YgaU
MVRSHKAIVSADPRTHQHKGQQVAALVSPANSSRYLLSGRAADAEEEEEIQEVESAPPADATKEEAADAKSTQAQEQVSELSTYCWIITEHWLSQLFFIDYCTLTCFPLKNNTEHWLTCRACSFLSKKL